MKKNKLGILRICTECHFPVQKEDVAEEVGVARCVCHSCAAKQKNKKAA